MPNTRKRRARASGSRRLAAIVGAVLLVTAALYLRSRLSQTSAQPPVPGLPVIAVKAKPKEIFFHGCPPEGDGGDSQLSLLKNRVDEGNWVPAEFGAVKGLPWPSSVERLARRLWLPDDIGSVARYEGIPLSIKGYLAGAREEGPESTNCHGAGSEMRDFHLWLVGSPDEDRGTSIVVELTPRIRALHPEWDADSMKTLVHSKERLRISGWLMLDPEHPDQVGKTRGTIWEIHPVMKIEVDRNGGWAALEGRPGQ